LQIQSYAKKLHILNIAIAVSPFKCCLQTTKESLLASLPTDFLFTNEPKC